MGITPGPEGYRPCFMPDGVTIIYETNETIGVKPVLMTWDGKSESSGQPFLNPTYPELAQTRPDVNASGMVTFTGVIDKASYVYFANENGGGVRAHNWKYMTYPCWTADGSIMATQFGTHSLVVFADDGPRTITPWNIFVGMASASPMASANPRDTIAVFAGQLNNNVDPYNEENNQIWRVNAGGLVQPVDPYQDQGRSPWWHPSGTYIALESKRSGNGYGIYTIFPDGKNLKGPYTDASIDANHPKFSPKGNKMVFAAKNKIGGNWYVAVMDPWPPP
jgi:hypothetical protein